ncbi:hypothetical protein [Wielerella bovis]|uniref:hypothetical protein n=1 Tax=Wielerella bovis TaxID=2917790 RepID=UPI002019925C|nr:hypothetical protein [Wielerella bovis]MCG7657176.1 hypothetical protein [Wielerella bovis]MCG7659399.1 hypothetical protein [Wielerella bovis]
MKIKLFITSLLLLSACHQAQNASEANPNPETASDVVANNPSIPIKVDLPIDFKGVNSLIHPIVVSAVEQYAEKSYSGSGKTVSSYIDVYDYQLSGKMFNLVFEDKQTGATKALFPHNTQFIHRAEYVIATIADKENEQKVKQRQFYRHFVYQVQEKLDEKAPFRKERALYLSDETGENLQKLHKNDEFLIETRWLPEMERYYFTTKSDSDQDGKITLADQSYNYYIDFKEKDKPVVQAYDFMPK